MAAVMKLSGQCGVRWWCPGCGRAHVVPVKPLVPPAAGRPGAPDGWDWNGSLDAPTLAPSVLVYEHKASPPFSDQPRCHTFIRDGRIEFLSDCTHALAGQTVAMSEVDQ